MTYLRLRTTALVGIFFILFGILIMVFKSSMVIYITVSLGWLICIISFLDLLIQQFDLKTLFYLSSSFLIGLIMINFPYLNLKVLILLFGLFCIGCAIAKGITLYQYHKNHIPYQWFLFLDTTAYLIIGLISVIAVDWILPKLVFYLGGYFILYGARLVRDGFEELFGSPSFASIRRRIRISIPVFFTSIIPKAALMNIERMINKQEELNEYKTDEKPDIEVMIHTAPSGHNMLGHVDLCIGETFITYGNYDFTTYRLFDSIGEGVIIIAPKKQYIEFSESYLKKTLVGFGLKLNEEQRKSVDAKLQRILENTVPWQPRAERDPEHANEYREYSSMLYKATHAQFYKVKSGRFKSFFILGTNCAQFCDSILGKAGTDILNLNGMLTPGTYYDYFNREFKKKNSLVISKKIYYMPEEKRKGKEVYQKGEVK